LSYRRGGVNIIRHKVLRKRDPSERNNSRAPSPNSNSPG